MGYDREYYLRNREKRLAYSKEYHKRNPEKRREASRKYREKNRDLILEKQRAKYHEDRDGHNARARQWKSENKSKVAKYAKKYAARNREHLAEAAAARRAGIRRATPKWVDRGALVEIYRKARRRGLCVDHIIPLKGDGVCGLHVPWNLQLLTVSENCSKGNRYEGSRAANRENFCGQDDMRRPIRVPPNDRSGIFGHDKDAP